VRWLAITARLAVVVPGVRSVPAHAEVETADNRRVGQPRDAPEPAGCRKHRRRIARKSPTTTTHLKLYFHRSRVMRGDFSVLN